MAKKNIGKQFDIFPMPVVLIGTVTDGKPNFMTAAWITKLNSDPPMVGRLDRHKAAHRQGHPADGRVQHQLSQRRPGCPRGLLRAGARL